MAGVNQIYLNRAGTWVQPVEILAWPKTNGTKLLSVRQGWVRDHGVWHKVFEILQDPPATMTTGPISNTQATVTWSVVPGTGIQYQAVMRPGAALTSAADVSAWSAGITATFTLRKDTVHTFTAKSRRPLKDGNWLESPESTAKLKADSGHAASINQSSGYPTPLTNIPVTAVKSDTWDNDKKWANGWNGDVVQGYASQAPKNGYGVIRYGKGSAYPSSGVWNQLADRYTPDIADNIEITDAKIEHVYRKQGGAGTPLINVYACDINFASNARPDNATSGTTFRAPAEGDSQDDFEFVHDASGDRLLNWVNAWANKSNTHNALLIFNNPSPDTCNPTAGYNGYAILRGANVAPADWRLRLSVRWSFNPVTAKPATWIP